MSGSEPSSENIEVKETQSSLRELLLGLKISARA
jgi:hypothetical protein